MPETALSNLLWMGRQHPLIQQACLGTKMFLGLGRPCFRKLFLGKGPRENLQQGLTGNSEFVAQPRADLASLLSPTTGNLLNHIVVIYGKPIEDVAKPPVLHVQRSAYEELLAVRTVTNEAFAIVTLDEAAIAQLPADGVPEQLLNCNCQRNSIPPRPCAPRTHEEPHTSCAAEITRCPANASAGWPYFRISVTTSSYHRCLKHRAF